MAFIYWGSLLSKRKTDQQRGITKSGYDNKCKKSRSFKRCPSKETMYGIYRRPWGFEVSLMRAGTRYTKRFSATRHAGMASALSRAQEWRDAVVKNLPVVERRELARKVRSNNTSGVAGVSCRFSPNGEPREWIAKTSVSGNNIVRVGFSVRVWGEAALIMAIEERFRQLGEMTGLAKFHPDEAVIRRGSANQPVNKHLPEGSPPEIAEEIEP